MYSIFHKFDDSHSVLLELTMSMWACVLYIHDHYVHSTPAILEYTCTWS